MSPLPEPDPADAFRQAVEEEDEFECTSCGSVLSTRSEPILVYRMTTRSLKQPRIQPLPPPLPRFGPGRDEHGKRLYRDRQSSAPIDRVHGLVKVLTSQKP